MFKTISSLCLVWASLLLLAAITAGQTNVIADEYFNIYYPSSRSKIAEQVSRVATWELKRISRNLKLTTVKRITISIIEENELHLQYADQLPEWGIAFAVPEKSHILLIYPNTFGKPSRLHFIIAHEIAHILTHRLAATFIPRWFDEGAAMYLSREPNMIDEMQLLLASMFGVIIPLQDIEHSFPQTGRRAQLAYIESLSTITFLMEEFGPSIIIQIIDQTREKNDFREGFIAATGMDLPQFELEWRTWIKKRFALAVILRPNLLFAFAGLLVVILGLLARLRRKRAGSIDEGVEE